MRASFSARRAIAEIGALALELLLSILHGRGKPVAESSQGPRFMASKTTSETADKKKLQVLVISDEHASSGRWGPFLRMSDYDARIATPNFGLNMAVMNVPDVIVVHLPLCLQMAAQIRSQEKLKDVVIVAITEQTLRQSGPKIDHILEAIDFGALQKILSSLSKAFPSPAGAELA
jgi:hypothetical protein